MPIWFRLISILALLFSAGTAVAAGPAPYDAAVFKQAQAAGKPIVIEIHADWCGECKMQNRVLNRLEEEATYSGFVRLRVDFDRQKELVRQFAARTQSTLVVYKGGKEVARAVGITRESVIRSLLDHAI